MITLLKSYPWIAGAGDTLYTPWVGYPGQLGDCELVIVVETLNTGAADVLLQTSVDGVASIDVGLPLVVNAVGPTATALDVEGTMVRLFLESANAALMTISVYLVPKQS